MGAPILPDHDIEIAFDVKFAEKDFGMVIHFYENFLYRRLSAIVPTSCI